MSYAMTTNDDKLRELQERLAKNKPRPYNLDDPEELLRLHRECHGYLRICHRKHGTDWEGRKFALDALEKLAKFPERNNIKGASK